MTRDGITHSRSLDKANILNDQFVSVFSNEDKSNLHNFGPSPYKDMPDIHISSAGVEKLLANAKPHNATGPDKIPAMLLKEAAVQLAPPLALIFQATIEQSCLVSWRTAYKKGDRNNASNYRPVNFWNMYYTAI